MEFIAARLSVITGAWGSGLTQPKVETFPEALNGAAKLFTGPKQRLYQHRAPSAQ